MEPIFENFEINTLDIWPYESNQFLNEKRTSEQIKRIKTDLEFLIVNTRREQILNKKPKTIFPFVTAEDYDNGTNKQWGRYINEIFAAVTLFDRIKLGYFNVIDSNGVDSMFSYHQDIMIDTINNEFDYWFALKLSQYETGIKYVFKFLDFQQQEVFKSDVSSFCEFLEDVILQFKDDFLDEKVCQKTEKWIELQKSKITIKHDSMTSKETIMSELKVKQFNGGYRTFLLKKVETNVVYFKLETNKNALIELWNDLTHEGFIEKQTIEKFTSIFLNVPIKKENRIVWSKSIKSLIEFVKALINSKNIVELGGVDHWLITMECFVMKKSKDIKFNSLEKPESKDSPYKQNIEFIVQNFFRKLE
jgi:hypothetical protein